MPKPNFKPHHYAILELLHTKGPMFRTRVAWHLNLTEQEAVEYLKFLRRNHGMVEASMPRTHSKWSLTPYGLRFLLSHLEQTKPAA